MFYSLKTVFINKLQVLRNGQRNQHLSWLNAHTCMLHTLFSQLMSGANKLDILLLGLVVHKWVKAYLGINVN